MTDEQQVDCEWGLYPHDAIVSLRRQLDAANARADLAEARVRELERNRRPVGVEPPVVTGSAVGEVDA